MIAQLLLMLEGASRALPVDMDMVGGSQLRGVTLIGVDNVGVAIVSDSNTNQFVPWHNILMIDTQT